MLSGRDGVGKGRGIEGKGTQRKGGKGKEWEEGCCDAVKKWKGKEVRKITQVSMKEERQRE